MKPCVSSWTKAFLQLVHQCLPRLIGGQIFAHGFSHVCVIRRWIFGRVLQVPFKNALQQIHQGFTVYIDIDIFQQIGQIYIEIR